MTKKHSIKSEHEDNDDNNLKIHHDITLFVILPLIDLKLKKSTYQDEEAYQTMLNEARGKLQNEQLKRNVFITNPFKDGEYLLTFKDIDQFSDKNETDFKEEEQKEEEIEADYGETSNVSDLFTSFTLENVHQFFADNNDINIDNIFQVLSKDLNFKYSKDSNFFKNEYLIKYEFRFEFNSTYTNLHTFIKNLFIIINSIKDRFDHQNIIIDVPNNTQLCLIKHIENFRFSFSRIDLKCNQLAFGTLVNMSKFFQRFFITTDELKITHFGLTINPRFKSLDILIFLPVEQIILKFVYRTTNIKSITLEKHDKFDRIFFDMNNFTKVYFRNGNWNHFIECFNECVQNWTRIDKVGIFDPHRKDERVLFKSLYSYEYGMSSSFFVDIFNDTRINIMDIFIMLIDDIRKLDNLHVSLYLSSIQINQITASSNDISDLLSSYRLPFDIYYACLVLFSKNFKTIDMMRDENFFHIFFELINETLMQTSYDELFFKIRQIENFIYYFSQQICDQFMLNIKEEFIKNFSRLNEIHSETLHPDYYFIRKAIIYPSHIEYHPPMPLLNSRFNKFADPDYTIRIRFFDDDGNLFGRGTFDDRKFAVKLVKIKLLDGLHIFDRHYQFLGSSSSQMREYSATLYAKDCQERDAKMIRDMNFSHTFLSQNQSVSKYMARFGLVFSQTLCIFTLKSDIAIQVIPDFEGILKPQSRLNASVRERYCLSDGIGYMSVEVGKYFYSYLPSNHQKGYIPSAYQIRFAGFKGVLIINPELNINKIVFRESMKKFDSSCRRMGLLKYSYPRVVYLNRPLLMILDDALKVSRMEFYKFFIDSTHFLSHSTTSEYNAFNFMQEFPQGYLSWSKIYSSGISLIEEPFLRSILEYLVYFRLDFELKQKSRIPVSPKIGRIAFGVLDDTKTLKPGQIFFQATQMNDDMTIQMNKTIILSGIVMVTKFPCMQPGDVRKFTAINVPALHHIRDCVVFPAVGNRSHSDEMGGSDLDGDEFAIFWNTNLIFNRPNQPPMDFPYGQTMPKIINKVENEDLIDFYCNFYENQNIGIVASQHLMIADYHPKGLFSSECETLAVNYNIMLDFSKTGFYKTSYVKYRMKYIPDYMRITNLREYYLSKKILGQFFRHCLLVEHSIDISKTIVTLKMLNFNQNQGNKAIKNHLTLSGWKYFYDAANEAFQIYKLRVTSILEQTEVKDEAILFSDIYDDKKESTNLLIKDLFSEFGALFRRQLNRYKIHDQFGRLLLASAWYSICFEKMFIVNDKPLLGLPWLIADELYDLAMYSYSGKFRNSENEIFRVTVKNSCPKFVRIGVLHNQIVQYNPENILQNGLKFEYKFSNHQFYSYQKPNTSLLKYYWSSSMIEEEIKNIEGANIMWKELINHATEEIVFYLIFNIIYRLRTEIYVESPFRNIKYKKIDCNEYEFLQNIVLKLINNVKIKIINHSSNCVPTISTLFNISILYLHNIVNNSHGIIENSINGVSNDLFLIKYSVFALIFLNKFSFHIDKIFYNFINIEFMQDRIRRVYMLEEICKTQDFVKKTNLVEEFLKSIYQHKSIFLDFSNKIFDDYLKDRPALRKKELDFHLLPMDFKFDDPKNEESFFKNLQFLSGIELIYFKPMDHDIYDKEMDFFSKEEDKWRNIIYFVHTVGYDHANTILQIFLGNPNFYTKILPFLKVS